MKTLLALLILILVAVGRAQTPEKKDATQRYAHMISQAAVVVFADVYCDEQFVYAVPREAWKNSGAPVAARIQFPRHKGDGFNPKLKPCPAVVWVSLPSNVESWGVSFSDGIHVGGPDGASVEGLRAYFKNRPNQPPEPTAPSGRGSS